MLINRYNVHRSITDALSEIMYRWYLYRPIANWAGLHESAPLYGTRVKQTVLAIREGAAQDVS